MRFRPVALAVLLACAPSTAHADHSITARYAISAVGVFCADGCPPLAMNIGGVLFRASLANGQTPSKVTIADMSGGSVAYQVAQTLDGDLVYGEDGEPQVNGCGKTVDLGASKVAFDPRYDVAVQIYTAAASCPSAATSGQVSLSYLTRR